MKIARAKRRSAVDHADGYCHNGPPPSRNLSPKKLRPTADSVSPYSDVTTDMESAFPSLGNVSPKTWGFPGETCEFRWISNPSGLSSARHTSASLDIMNT
jgi:hypothetical protein